MAWELVDESLKILGIRVPGISSEPSSESSCMTWRRAFLLPCGRGGCELASAYGVNMYPVNFNTAQGLTLFPVLLAE